MMKKIYVVPRMEAVEINQHSILCASGPGASDVVGGSGQFAPEFSDIDWEALEKGF